jgi:putative sterol carrier protein
MAEGAQLRDGGGDGSPDATVRCSAGTLWRLLDGSYSPVEAFRDGLMQLDGDERAAKRLLRHLAGPDGLVDCR